MQTVKIWNNNPLQRSGGSNLPTFRKFTCRHSLNGVVGQQMKHSELLNDLIGIHVSHVWFSDFSVVYFELGDLTPNTKMRRDASIVNPHGQFCIYTGFDWRIERPRSILCSRNSARKKRESVCKSLLGTTISTAEVFGKIPELVIEFSNGLRLMTFGLSPGQPDWSVGCKDRGIHLSSNRGSLITEQSDKTKVQQTDAGNRTKSGA